MSRDNQEQDMSPVFDKLFPNKPVFKVGPKNCENPECPYGHYRDYAVECCCMACVGHMEEKEASHE